jgi:hypothetical protein
VAACLLAVAALTGLAACSKPSASSGLPAVPTRPAIAFAPLPAGLGGVLTYQRDGNVYVLLLDSKAERKVTDFPPQSQAVFSARSPDGAHLAYVRIEGFGSTLWVSDATGGGERKLVDESSSYATLERPQWTPDSKAIVYTYHAFIVEGGAIKGETIRGEKVDPETGERTPLAPDAEGPTMAPDGSMAFVRTTRTGQQLVLLDPDGTEKILVPERSFSSMAAPKFSPDGKRIGFAAVGTGPTSGQTAPGTTHTTGLAAVLDGLRGALGPSIALAHGEPWDIWMAEVGGSVKMLSKLTEDEPTVTWSADSRYAAVSGGTGVYVIDAANGQTSQLTQVGGFGGIDWTR